MTTAVSGCGDDSTADASTSTIAPSDMSRIAASNSPHSSAPDASASLSSATSTTPATSPASSGDSSSSRDASVSSSAPGTTSKAGAAALVIPDAAKAHTKDGAKAFVKFYWETLDQLDAAPKVGVLEQLAAPDCRSCISQRNTIATMVRDGSHIDAASPHLSNVAIRSDSTNDSIIVTFDQTAPPAAKVSADGKRTTLPKTSLKVAARADWVGNAWKLGESGADQN